VLSATAGRGLARQPKVTSKGATSQKMERRDSRGRESGRQRKRGRGRSEEGGGRRERGRRARLRRIRVRRHTQLDHNVNAPALHSPASARVLPPLPHSRSASYDNHHNPARESRNARWWCIERRCVDLAPGATFNSAAPVFIPRGSVILAAPALTPTGAVFNLRRGEHLVAHAQAQGQA
jgi:hypothetical protein